MTQNFPNFMVDINPQVQETQRKSKVKTTQFLFPKGD